MTPLAPRALPPITYPESLPVSGRRDEIARAIREHPVVIVCGETGSGKTTQLPKIALELGRGLQAGGTGLIGHTQPRRIAASSVAKRIAEELNSPLGEVVGFKVRFQDRLQRGASVKLMTDGILLAETQTDPLLKAYDTLIIDEAHERSLNIDFLLGYLKQLLPRRPDLKVIVTSATIDADRFANHFASAKGPAPVIQVSGRLFPVEQRWRPFEESREHDLNDAIADAVDELWRDKPGDILVFLPGEREIREAADHLHKHLAQQHRGGPPAEILPLFARLSQAEQDRVFNAGNGRRIVLATNVAETSLTVPGIRCVIDAGLARVKRYSYRNKVEQLLVEPISQAAANQRAGRCGRVADGICIRLYDEASFGARPQVHRPRDPALVAGRRDPAHDGAQARRGGGLSVPGSAAQEGHRRRLCAAGRAERGGRAQRHHAHRPRARPPAAGPAHRPHDPGSARARCAGRGADHRLGAVGAGRARPAAGGAAGGRRKTQEVRRREVGVQWLPEAVEVDRGRAWPR